MPARPPLAPGALWNEGLCGCQLDGPQLMRKSLGGIRHHGELVLENTRTDDEVLAALAATLEERLADAPKGEYEVFLPAIRNLPPGLRAMAATHEFDVSMTLDDLGWHFANWHNLELAEETSHGLRELEAHEIADIFDQALTLVRPHWDMIGSLRSIDFDNFIEWYWESELQTSFEPLNTRLYDLLGSLPHGLMTFWIQYARRYPERVS